MAVNGCKRCFKDCSHKSKSCAMFKRTNSHTYKPSTNTHTHTHTHRVREREKCGNSLIRLNCPPPSTVSRWCDKRTKIGRHTFKDLTPLQIVQANTRKNIPQYYTCYSTEKKLTSDYKKSTKFNTLPVRKKYQNSESSFAHHDGSQQP